MRPDSVRMEVRSRCGRAATVSDIDAVSYDEFKKASEGELVPRRISEGTIGELAELFQYKPPAE